MKKILGLLVAVSLVGCGDIDVPDLNNPSVDALEKTPTRSAVMAASTGLIIGSRAGMAATNGYVAQLGILGREIINFDTADPRYFQELLESETGLDPGSPAFGGNFWNAPYRNLKNARTVLAALDSPVLKGVTDEEKEAIRGFSNTMSALDYLQIINTRDSQGAVDAHAEPDPKTGLYPLVSKEAIFDRIVGLLDDADAQLERGGEEFPFPLSKGFDGFDTPTTFRKFNRALRARVAAYRKDWSGVLTALDASFIDRNMDATNAADKLKLGVYFTYTTDSNDATNGLNAPVLYVHPDIVDGAEHNPELSGNPIDERVTAYVKDAEKQGSNRGMTSTYQMSKYDQTSPVAIIRNEELVLLRAEAHIGLGDINQAAEDLNLIRGMSGKLPPRTDLTAGNIVDELLKQRRYSLLFEGGHSWIDARRYDKMTSLPLGSTNVAEHYYAYYFPIPTPEMDARK